MLGTALGLGGTWVIVGTGLGVGGTAVSVAGMRVGPTCKGALAGALAGGAAK